uniref:Thioredoxin-like fold domain-containing protein n=1 Tax=Chaetoceros debilis TaxID=122233 RepID=A0A7S3PVF3_9STRA|mmetsp:Transcript_6112/g.8993  ORF Transcript_6112/g.8993 Transcript_6112/m.8993 type:complete len:150 (+) Transcript_6112:167-616(+)|eukprot:CAMPEP_0194084532 /NCGR_PEP_ID=MMETSP0149-20130528/13766_1 /TAXON_ID=122233 /ORGANISM="Chaetoceros debilis, Strain MM31A-1" /LENGTH=149 /DNA_ID=CAMNT_0038767209 /DNA_START=75 /DNA_END=524 /DNA_ORIENTATION=-
MLTTSFPSLGPALSSSKVMGLYFASAWCPDCSRPTPALKTIFETPGVSEKLSIVYVSSDNSEEQMMSSYNKSHGKWGIIPFDSPERNELKKKFGVCAGKESAELGLMGGKRKYGIPTLILIDSNTEEVLSFDGVNDVMSGGLTGKWGLL